MTSKEIVRRCIRHGAPERIAFDFLDPAYQDIRHVAAPRLRPVCGGEYAEWGEYAALSEAAGFRGETRRDVWGNIYGRIGGRTKGECVLGAMQSGWDLTRYALPEIEGEYRLSAEAAAGERYLLSGLPVGVFSTLRDVRRIDNALMDTLEEPEMVSKFEGRVSDLAVRMVELLAAAQVDGVILYDDWGTQKAPLISPRTFRALFAPHYRKIADACHARGMDFLLHSCGYVLPLAEDMLEAGVDVFQFDQPEAAGSGFWAREFGRRAAFYLPVDIQKVLPTGDRGLIEATALRMTEDFKACGGSLIAKDYPSLEDIGVKPEWANWAREVIVKHARM